MKFIWSAIKWLGGTAIAGAGVDQIDDKYFDGKGKRTAVDAARSALDSYNGNDENQNQSQDQEEPAINTDASMSSAWEQLKQGNISKALDETASVLSNDFNADQPENTSGTPSPSTNEQEEKKETDLTGDLLKWLGLGGATVGGGFLLTKALGAMFNNSGNSEDSGGSGIVTKLLVVGVLVGIMMNWKTIDNALGLSDKFNSLTGGGDDNIATRDNENGVDFTSDNLATFDM